MIIQLVIQINQFFNIMQIAVFIGISIFTILLAHMTYKEGVQSSISQLVKNHRWLLLIALVSQVLLLPQMLEITPEPWKFIPFIGTCGIVLCGAANVLKKEDELVHMIAAIISAICFIGWVLLLNWYFLLPIIICIVAGKDNFKWRLEIGLIISVYITLIFNIFD